MLLSFATATVFSIAGLMVLAELGIQLAPLLASAGIAGIALGFGAQTLVKDLLAGLFMLMEDQYGVGDAVDVGEASGVVESVGLRITSIRDARGVLWHVRNGEIVRVGNKSQGWALGIIDVPVGFARVDDATKILQDAGEEFANDPAVVEGPDRSAGRTRRRTGGRGRRGSAGHREDDHRIGAAGRSGAAYALDHRARRQRHHRCDDQQPGVRASAEPGRPDLEPTDLTVIQ